MLIKKASASGGSFSRHFSNPLSPWPAAPHVCMLDPGLFGKGCKSISTLLSWGVAFGAGWRLCSAPAGETRPDPVPKPSSTPSFPTFTTGPNGGVSMRDRPSAFYHLLPPSPPSPLPASAEVGRRGLDINTAPPIIAPSTIPPVSSCCSFGGD